MKSGKYCKILSYLVYLNPYSHENNQELTSNLTVGDQCSCEDMILKFQNWKRRIRCEEDKDWHLIARP
ncbi:hypothetical protein H5410_041351 [Solanum commersonii]|uniref:Uncharacterized protein n=1 Tax=Solanum commersonii TaxID=4109 RepID=A0A9J5XSQ0_SOLCO|nr:hypothetical protein H5410_041351 [Solanum commersonii]